MKTIPYTLEGKAVEFMVIAKDEVTKELANEIVEVLSRIDVNNLRFGICCYMRKLREIGKCSEAAEDAVCKHMEWWLTSYAYMDDWMVNKYNKAFTSEKVRKTWIKLQIKEFIA